MGVIVVGAGWSGLAVATFLEERGQHVEVIEAGDRAGGRIETLHQDGFLIEAGPNAVAPGSHASRTLLEASKTELVTAARSARRFIVHNGRPHCFPSRPREILTTPLLSAADKARVLAEPFRDAGPPGETLGAFTRRRLGAGVSAFADALATGVYGGDPARLIVQHAFPKLYQMDQRGGILRALARPRASRSGLTSGLYGMQAIADSLAARASITYGDPVIAVEEKAQHVEVHTRLGQTMRADHVVLATEPNVTRRLLSIDREAPPVAPVHIVAFGLPAPNAPREGYGILAPEAEGRFILGAHYESNQFPGRAPLGRSLLRCLVGGRRHPERAGLPLARIAREAWDDLAELGIVKDTPTHTFHIATRGIPQPEEGQAAWMDALPRTARIHATGIGHRGVGLRELADEAYALVMRLA